LVYEKGSKFNQCKSIVCKGVQMLVGVLKEQFPGEQRVALVPAHVPILKKMGISVILQAKAGSDAGYSDAMYVEKGAKVVPSRKVILRTVNILVSIRSGAADIETTKRALNDLKLGSVIIGLMNPYKPADVFAIMVRKKMTAFALELVPRISRAQDVDVLSSIASVVGYKGVLMAASLSKKMFPMMITAAGTVSPAKVFVIGAGVAGLQAIAMAKRIGASVSAYDIRPEVKEQVESLGARFISFDLEVDQVKGEGGYARKMDEDFYRKQRVQMEHIFSESDVVITTAAVPGKKAPILVSKNLLAALKPGSVVVDLSADSGGNCVDAVLGKTITTKNGVIISAPLNVASDIATHASQMLSKNLCNFITHIIKNKHLSLDMDDEVIQNTLIIHQGAFRRNAIIPKKDEGKMLSAKSMVRKKTASKQGVKKKTNPTKSVKRKR